nr:hypothetical protein CFP56_22428 [Quercus suber]
MQHKLDILVLAGEHLRAIRVCLARETAAGDVPRLTRERIAVDVVDGPVEDAVGGAGAPDQFGASIVVGALGDANGVTSTDDVSDVRRRVGAVMSVSESIKIQHSIEVGRTYSSSGPVVVPEPSVKVRKIDSRQWLMTDCVAVAHGATHGDEVSGRDQIVRPGSLSIAAYRVISVVLYTLSSLGVMFASYVRHSQDKEVAKETRTSFEPCYIPHHLTCGALSSVVVLNGTARSWQVASAVPYGCCPAAGSELRSLDSIQGAGA